MSLRTIRPFSTIVFLAICLIGTSICSNECYGQKNPAELEKQVPWSTKTDVNRIVIKDIQRHIGDLVNHQILDDFGRLLGETDPSIIQQIEILRNGFENSKKDFPNSIRISENGESGKWLNTSYGLTTLFTYNFVQLEHGNDKTEKEIGEVLKDFVQLAKNNRLPDLSIVATWDNPDTPQLVMDHCSQQGPLLLGMFGLKVEKQKDSLVVKGKLSSILSPDVLFNTKRFLRKGWIQKSDADAFRKIFSNAKIHLQFSRVGNSLVLNLGENRKLTAGQYLKEIANTNNKRTISFGSIDLRPINKQNTQWKEFFAKWKDSELAKLARQEIDADEMAESGFYSSVLMSQGADSFRFKFFTEKQCLSLDLDETNRKKAPTIASAKILRFVPEDAEAIQIDSRNNYGTVLANSLMAAEGRLDRKALTGDESSKLRANRISELYYSNFSAVRQIIYSDLPEVLVPPYAIMMIPPKSLGITIEHDGNTINLQNAKTPSFAVVTACSDQKECQKITDELSAEFSIALFNAIGLDTDKISKGVFNKGKQIDGHPVWWMDTEEIQKNGVGIEFQGDFHPHFLFKDKYLIFSCSKSFTQSVLKTEGRRKIDNDKLVTFTNFQGKHLAQIFGGIMSMVVHGLEQETERNPLQALMLQRTMEMLQNIPLVVDRYTWKTIQKEAGFQSKIKIRFSRLGNE